MSFLIMYASDGTWHYAHGHTFPQASVHFSIPLWSLFRRDDTGDTYEWNGSAWLSEGGGGAPTDASYVTTAAEAGLSNESTLGTVIGRGAIGSRPAAGIAGRLWYDTTNSILTRDNGASWDTIGESAAPAPDSDARFLALAAM